MGSVLILQNAPLFTAGNLEEELKLKGIPYQYRKLYEGEKLPSVEAAKHYSGYIVLGGPLRFRADTPEKTRWGAQEIFFLRACVELHKPIIALSQGSVLLAKAQGARVERLKEKIIGWESAEIYPDYSRNSVVFSEITEKRFPAFCWFDTMNGFPPSGYWYVYNSRCRHFSTGINGNCYLFNFHPEVNEALLEQWLKEYGKELGDAAAHQAIRDGAAEGIAFAKKLSHKLIHAFESFLK